MKQFFVLIIMTLSFVCQGQIVNDQDIDFNDIVEKNGLFYLKADSTLVTGRVIRYNKKKEARRYVMVNNGKPEHFGWQKFPDDQFNEPKESALGTIVTGAALITGLTMAVTGNEIEKLPINNRFNYDQSVKGFKTEQKDYTTKVYNEMSQRNEMSQSLLLNSNSNNIKELNDDLPAIKENDIDREKNGTWEEYYKNGQLKSEGNYINNNKDGLWQEYYKNGLLNTRINYKNGKEDGLLEVYHENGKLLMRGSFEVGKQTGEWNYYDESGTLTKTENFDD